jgi:hypothetical protein
MDKSKGWVSVMAQREYSKDTIRVYDTKKPDQRTSPTDVTGNESGNGMRDESTCQEQRSGSRGQGRRENEPLGVLLLEAGIRGDQSCIDEKPQKTRLQHPVGIIYEANHRFTYSLSGLNVDRADCVQYT